MTEEDIEFLELTLESLQNACKDILSLNIYNESSSDHRKKFLPKEARLFLERVFEKKQSLNSKERDAIAKKCGLTPLQVRVWFINKRMRSK
ncbi:mating-type (MAT) locus a1 gene [Vanderwaltozyma polyspora DSM 70294]|uniref:HMR mating-type cassette a1 protein n=1 Tax=Vanderwaltozyma polyspora (strain ATCC 22028 / DSM 70294 / BCRC 21397 / CBS 2163 / NBRC 10782 / NRRL Y-8283 / UCD 57-17) TaxID=436907 RepID=A7TFG3_VANPO|nr:HMR mating-type cassette a1 protein [Vanderwaltozyma polyspora DSM 70294]XP_001645324.1 HMR mating-type cassette a1 protein [Vanderwaltozyma polyspora DSM 70294]XP_001646835.1 mating-type (MAT) locus a1 gene [Vanderwaltozyma polyspora DSM 70294]EDO14945.1 HMR mating-type cassette a1 protein [Vanderwaltozyma polyspora DSM 70294]EDO17466.1 HMR mating-type cassette a1 protein [Vanderwaltozyma polyspora DSM 70294]EDO18977.1 mating-type (MAT) locus a1 gene [Vanderwaltozyma polyspora DSM 70294]